MKGDFQSNIVTTDPYGSFWFTYSRESSIKKNTAILTYIAKTWAEKWNDSKSLGM